MKKHLLTFTLVATLGLATACGSEDVPSGAQVSTATGTEEAFSIDADIPEGDTFELIEGTIAEAATDATEGTTAVAATGATEGTTAGTEVNGSQAEAAEGSVIGVVEEIKEFKIIILDEATGTYYDFPIEEVDLGDIKVGDKVKVTYNGIISEVDPFKGKVLSVEKAAE